MGAIRIIVGIIVLGFGSLMWLSTLYGNVPMPGDTSSTIPQILNFDIVVEMIIDSIIIGVGFMILIWGVRSSQSSNG